MKVRVQDKIPAIRVFAVRAVSRFAIDEDDGGIIDIFLGTLEKEQNAVCQINYVPRLLTLDLLLHLIDVLFHLRRRSGRQLFCLCHHPMLHWSQSSNQRWTRMNQFGEQRILCFRPNFPCKVLGEQLFPLEVEKPVHQCLFVKCTTFTM